MSTINLAKKLQPAKKAWKSFTTSLQSKLLKFKTCETIKRTKPRCIIAWRTFRSFISRKLYALTRRSTARCRYHLYHHHQCHHLQKRYATIYIDELFPKPRHEISIMQQSKAKEVFASSGGVTTNMEKKQRHDHEVASIGVKIVEKKVMPEKGKAGKSSKLVAADKLKLPMLPQLRGIDERAEEFISKFREEMKLERQNSILDFQEMLERSV